MKELTVKDDTLFIMVPTFYPTVSKDYRIKINDDFDVEEEEISLEDLMEEFNYSMLRVLGHNYIWEEFINDLKINIVMNQNIPFDRLTRTESYNWKKKPFESLRCLGAFTLSAINKAEEEGMDLPIDIREFKRKMKDSGSFMTFHSFIRDAISDMDIIIIRNFFGSVILKKNYDSLDAEELVTIKDVNNNPVVI